VERNALRANLVERAEDWRWSSLWRRHCGVPEAAELLSDWPTGIPGNWRATVNRPQNAAELDGIRLAVRRGRPFGSPAWITRTANRLGLESTLRPRGRPRKENRRR
jgi:putative transposase